MIFRVPASLLVKVSELGSAQKGIACCEYTRSTHLDVGELHGTHDGRVCCKMYSGLAMQALGQPGASEWITKALEFSANKDPNTKTLGRAYSRLYYLMDGDLDAASSQQLSVCDPGASRTWNQFFSLTQQCMEIAIHLKGEERLRDNVQKLNTELQFLRTMDFSSLWSAFLALANWRLGESEYALDSLTRSIVDAVDRKELAYLPFCHEIEQIIRGVAPDSAAISPLLQKIVSAL